MTENIYISFVGRDAVSKDFSVLTSRSVKTITAKFEFDESWDEFPTKTAIFANGDKVVAVILDSENSCTVPWEVLTAAGTLTVGVVGQNGEKILPSVSISVPLVEGIYTEGTAPSEPSPDVYEQLLQLMQETQKIAESVRDDAAAGKFDGKDGDTPQRGVDYWTEEDKAEIVEDVLAALPTTEGVYY